MDVFAVKFVSAFEDVDELIFCLFLFALPFGWSLSIVFLLLFLVSRTILLVKEKGTFNKTNILWSIPVLMLFLIGLISVSYSDNTSYALTIVSSQLSFLLIPFLVGFKSFKQHTLNKAFNWFVLGNIVTGIIAFIRAFIRSFYFDGEKLTLFLTLKEKTSNILDSDVAGHLFWGQDFSPFIHSAYWGLMILFAFSYLFFRYYNDEWQNKRWLARGAMAFLLLLIICNGTNGVVLAFALLSVACIVLWWQYRGMLKDRIMIFPIVLVALAISLSNPQTRTLVKQIKSDADNSFSNRIELFQSIRPVLQKTPFFGYGIGDTRDLLSESYIVAKQDEFAKQRLNAHNQFIETYLGLGVPGLMALLMVFISVFIKAWRKKNYLLFSWGLIFIALMMTENILFRYNGIVFFAVSFMLIQQFVNGKVNQVEVKE